MRCMAGALALPAPLRLIGGRRRGPVTAAPVAIAPRPPPGIAAQRLGRWIPAVPAPWMAAADPRRRHPGARPGAVATDRVGGVGRAGRQVAAIAPDEGRERPLVELDEA